MSDKLNNFQAIMSLNDCMSAMYANAVQPKTTSNHEIKQLESVAKVTRQFEKIIVSSMVAGTFLSLNMFIGSVSLLCTSGLSFVVPLTLSVGAALITVDMMTAKMLVLKIKKLAVEQRVFYTKYAETDSKEVLETRWCDKIKKISQQLDDFLILPNPSAIELVSFRQLISCFLLKQLGKMTLVQNQHQFADQDTYLKKEKHYKINAEL